MNKFKRYFPYILYLGLTMLIMWPLFRPGFVFLLDMVFVPNIDLQDSLTSGIPVQYPFILLIKLFSYILPVDLIQKIILSLLLFLPGALMYRLSKMYISPPWAFLSGLIFMLNPWTYERFLSGHWYVYLGYAILPLFVKLSVQLLETNFERKNKWMWLGLIALYPVMSLHWAYIAIILFIVLAGVYKELGKMNFVKFMALTILVMLVVNSYWIVGGFFREQNTFQNITQADFEAFETEPDPQFGIFFNVLSLYGFWNTDYPLPKDDLSFWWGITIAYLLFSLIGAYIAIKNKNKLGTVLIILFLPILVLSVGTAHAITEPIVNALSYIPGFKGLRETAKLIGMVAFTYSILVPLGARIAFNWVSNNTLFVPQQLSKKVLYAAVLFVPILSVQGMFFGFNNQVKAVEYPQSWYAAEQLLQDQQAAKVLVLPWWAYVRLPWADNNLIVNPSTRFFESDVIVSRKFENIYIETQENELDRRVEEWIESQTITNEDIEYIKSQGVSHIMLLTEQDSFYYSFLEKSSGVTKVLDTEEINVFNIH